MLINKGPDAVRPRQVLSPQCPDGIPGFGKTRSGKLLGLLDRFEDSGIRSAALGQEPCALKLKNKA